MFEITIRAAADGDYGHVAVNFDGTSNYAHDPKTHAVGLGMSCQFDRQGTGTKSEVEGVSQPYAYRLGLTEGSYWHPHDIDACERALRVGRRMTRAFERMRDTFGRPATFGQWVAYHLSGLKLELDKVTVVPAGSAPYVVENRALADVVDDLVNRTQRKLERKAA